MISRTVFLTISVISAMSSMPRQALACPEGQTSGFPGVCYPNIGGDVGNAWEKGKEELKNFENDAREWMETGTCGGDFCDIFEAATNFVEATTSDIGPILKSASLRLSEGKPIDAIWHLTTDPVRSSSKNAAIAAQQSRVLAATGQVAATAYGGPGGAAAYTAWLTYETTGNLSDAIRAGAIAGATSAAMSSISEIDIDGAGGIVARSAMTGAVSGAAVALAGGNADEVRAAIGLGVTATLLREGYRKLTDLDLDRERLRSSTGDAYCLKAIPTPGDFDTPGNCFGPREAYTFNEDQTVKLDDAGEPLIEFKELDPNRPHVGIWADGTEGSLNIVAENSGLMTGISRMPGWNAMAVGHDQLTSDLSFNLIPGGMALTVGTIPPAVVATYLGSGMGVQDAIREASARDNASEKSDEVTTLDITSNIPSHPSPLAAGHPETKEVLHLICRPSVNSDTYLSRTDIIVEVYLGQSGVSDGRRRICEVSQNNRGIWFDLGHAHYDRNYCHRVAERLVVSRQKDDQECFGSIGMQSSGSTSDNSN